jgi:hypothetical protein
MTGTWSTIFTFMRKALCLQFLNLGMLSQDEYRVSFSDIVRSRPVVLDSELANARSTMWHWAMWAELGVVRPRSATWDAKTKELDEATANDWVWVAQNTGAFDYIILDVEDGDDVMSQMAMVEEQHQLV